MSLRKLVATLSREMLIISGVSLAEDYGLCHYFTLSTCSHSDLSLSLSRVHAIPLDLVR